MATLKIKYFKDPGSLVAYVTNKVKDKDLITCNESDPENIVKAFKSSERMRGREKSQNKAVHIIQSFSHEVSEKIGENEVHRLGLELANRKYSNHQFMVVTHTDTKHYHNHIIINPVSIDYKDRIANKKRNLYDLRELNDEICIENNLPVIDNDGILKKKPTKINKSLKWRHLEADDLKEKVFFALEISSNQKELTKNLKNFDIDFTIEKSSKGWKQAYIKAEWQNKKKSLFSLGPEFRYKSLKKGLKANELRNFYKDSNLEDKKSADKFKRNLHKLTKLDLETVINKFDLNVSKRRNKIEIKNLGEITVAGNKFHSQKFNVSGNAISLLSIANNTSYYNAIVKLAPETKELIADNTSKDLPVFTKFNKPGLNYTENRIRKIETESRKTASNLKHLVKNGFVTRNLSFNRLGFFDSTKSKSNLWVQEYKGRTKFDIFYSGQSFNLKNTSTTPLKSLNLYPIKNVFDVFSIEKLENSNHLVMLSTSPLDDKSILSVDVRAIDHRSFERLINKPSIETNILLEKVSNSKSITIELED